VVTFSLRGDFFPEFSIFLHISRLSFWIGIICSAPMNNCVDISLVLSCEFVDLIFKQFSRSDWGHGLDLKGPIHRRSLLRRIGRNVVGRGMVGIIPV
jgi:hypothetical protein